MGRMTEQFPIRLDCFWLSLEIKVPFHIHFPHQGATHYKRWKLLPSRKGIWAGYEVKWKNMYEPFFISRNSAPSFDERFRNYGYDRSAYMCELHVAGYRFAVLDNAYILHDGFKEDIYFSYPHAREGLKANAIVSRKFRAELQLKYNTTWRSCESWFLHSIEFLHVFIGTVI
ncbi:unnamed protein product [Darwinula stevensoni]|uniref:Beta-1,4-glucuronyltransferase 1 n=1 Tax=Darwinula stevensoni TaxID=69355 RepID=A0A7R9AGD6_9CRUS|nr:unnamed protein product [Darwinula stevensoni]CAG0903565.1 unnamed protein product [Darwinula stevensoni]